MKWTLAQNSPEDTPFLRLHDSVYSYSFGYYTNNMWLDSRRLILSRSEDFYRPGPVELILVDLEQQSETPLGLLCQNPYDYVVSGTLLYYVYDHTLFAYSLTDGTRRALCHQNGMYFPHITADGRMINWMLNPSEKEQRPILGVTLDLTDADAEPQVVITKTFARPFRDIGHVMVSPTDPDLLFFCHEGTTEYISNRLWLQPRGGTPYPIAPQKLNRTGDLGDCFGHECWAPDGKGLYFVKYSCSPEPPRGICYVDIAQNQVELLYQKYPYWHVCCSPDDRWLASDTQSGSYSGVCIINRLTGEESMPVRANSNWQHPCHPHPQFNPVSDRLCFHDLYEGRVSVGILSLPSEIR